MAINKNHTAEELNGTKCAIVAKNVPIARAEFLKTLLLYNKYTVIVQASPPPPPSAEGQIAVPIEATFTVGVTDLHFNSINAVYGRMLKTTEGKVVTLAYWQQEDATSQEYLPYFANTKEWGTAVWKSW